MKATRDDRDYSLKSEKKQALLWGPLMGLSGAMSEND